MIGVIIMVGVLALLLDYKEYFIIIRQKALYEYLTYYNAFFYFTAVKQLF